MKERIGNVASFLMCAAALSAFANAASAQYYTPTPPVVVYPQPAPPQVMVLGPQQPPPVYVQPPPPPVYIQQQPQVVYLQPPQTVLLRPQMPAYDPLRNFGITANFAWAFGSGHDGGNDIGGFNVGTRFRLSPWISLQLSLGYFAGQNTSSTASVFGEGTRQEVPFTGDVYFYLTRPHRLFRAYLLGGLGVSWAKTQEGSIGDSSIGSHHEMTYLGGEAGAGIELNLSQHFSLTLEERGFIRQRVTGGPALPDYIDGSRSTNTSGGAVTMLGAVLYL